MSVTIPDPVRGSDAEGVLRRVEMAGRRRNRIPAVDCEPDANTGFETITINGAQLFGGQRYSAAPASGDEVSYDEGLSAGTWKLRVAYVKNVAYAIGTVSVDGVDVGTIDSYIASGNPTNNVASFTGIVVPTAKNVRVRIRVVSRNASATGWFFLLQGFEMRRTA